ncbi:MAG: alpha/beta hydrolase domain-containing protein [Holdemanella porci]
MPVNQYEVTYDYSYKLTRVEYVEQPYISMQTESENSQTNSYSTQRQDSDQWNFMYRNYEVTGSSHDTMYNYVNYYQNDPDLISIDHLPKYSGKHERGNDYPSQILFAAGFKNLFRWVEEGVGPNYCQRIQIDGQGHNQKMHLEIQLVV